VELLLESLKRDKNTDLANELLKINRDTYDLLPNTLSDLMVLSLFISVIIIGVGVYFLFKKLKCLELNIYESDKFIKHKFNSATFSRLTSPNNAIKIIDNDAA